MDEKFREGIREVVVSTMHIITVIHVYCACSILLTVWVDEPMYCVALTIGRQVRFILLCGCAKSIAII